MALTLKQLIDEVRLCHKDTDISELLKLHHCYALHIKCLNCKKVTGDFIVPKGDEISKHYVNSACKHCGVKGKWEVQDEVEFDEPFISEPPVVVPKAKRTKRGQN